MTQHPAIFLPGILMPAVARYAPLGAALRGDRPTLTKELEVYAGPEPPSGYSLDTEVEGLARFCDSHSLGRFHLYGHSAGGAVALAYVAAHPDRVLSLALDEPATDFSAEDAAAIEEGLPGDLDALAPADRMALFARSLVRPEVDLGPPRPFDGPEMGKRPRGLTAFRRALIDHGVDRRAVVAFGGPVYFSYGSMSNQRWEAMAERFSEDFARCTVQRFEGIHHLHTSHQAEPEVVAEALDRLWLEADGPASV